MLKTSWMAVLGLALALMVTVRVEQGRVDRERGRVAVLALEAANAAAERDSTRDVALTQTKVADLLGDSLRLAERLVVQATQRANALDQALGHELRARYQMAETVDSISRELTAASVADSNDMRRARFDVREAPYTIVANVAMPAPPDSAHLAIEVALDAIPVDLRLGCVAPDHDGVHAASIDAITPRWATVRFSRVEQTPELCASPALLGSPPPEARPRLHAPHRRIRARADTRRELDVVVVPRWRLQLMVAMTGVLVVAALLISGTMGWS